MDQDATDRTIVEDEHKRLTLLGQYADSRLWWAERRTADGVADAENAHYFLQLRGSYRERGRAYGYLMANQILATAVDMKAFFQPPVEWAQGATDPQGAHLVGHGGIIRPVSLIVVPTEPR